MWGSDPCFSSPTAEGRSSPVFPPSSFILPSFAWFYIFFSTGWVLLSALSWCSACTSVSEGVFLMYHGEKGTPRLPTPRPSCSPRICFSESALHIRCMMDQSLYCSAADTGVQGERETMVMAPPSMHDSAVLPCFHGCLAFLH